MWASLEMPSLVYSLTSSPGVIALTNPSPPTSLSDKGQKSDDKVADLLAWEECEAGGALEIREGGELRFH